MTPVSFFVKDYLKANNLSQTQEELIKIGDVLGMCYMFSKAQKLTSGNAFGKSVDDAFSRLKTQEADASTISEAAETGTIAAKIIKGENLTEAEAKKVNEELAGMTQKDVNDVSGIVYEMRAKQQIDVLQKYSDALSKIEDPSPVDIKQLEDINKQIDELKQSITSSSEAKKSEATNIEKPVPEREIKPIEKDVTVQEEQRQKGVS